MCNCITLPFGSKYGMPLLVWSLLEWLLKWGGGGLGEVVEVERRRKHDDPNYFMRVKVALPILKPLRRGGFLAGSDGERSWVRFKYERLPMFCHYCSLMGHGLRHYPSHFNLTKSGAEVEYQYGDWLKAMGGRR